MWYAEFSDSPPTEIKLPLTDRAFQREHRSSDASDFAWVIIAPRAPTKGCSAMTLRRTYYVISYGPGLRECMSDSSYAGEVVAVFRSSFYVRDSSGGLLCVASHTLEDGPIMLKVRFPTPCDLAALGVKVGMALLWENGGLLLGNSFRFDMSRSTAWVPPVIKTMASPWEVSLRLRTLVRRLLERIPDAGLAPLLPCAEDLAYGSLTGISCNSEAAIHAVSSVRRLVQGICEGDLREIDVAIGRIVGLGPGLTPSGDDVLGGAILGMNAVIDAYVSEGGNEKIVGAGWREIVSFTTQSIVRHASGTTDISAALLRHAAKGVASAPVHRLLLHLLHPGCTADLVEGALAVADAGHTSGWDMLAGLALGMHLGLRIIDEEYTGLAGGRPVRSGQRRLLELETR